MSDCALSGFFSEIEKISVVSKSDIKDRVEVTRDFDRIKSIARPGDIFVSKTSHPDLRRKISLLAHKILGGTEWTHAGVVDGLDEKSKKPKIIHSYPALRAGGKKIGDWGSRMVREHQIDRLKDIDKDVLLLRHKNKKYSEEASRRAKSTVNTKYTPKPILELLRTILAPRKERDIKGKRKDIICTGVVGYSYPKTSFRKGIDINNIRPLDIIRHPDFKQILAYSHPGE